MNDSRVADVGASRRTIGLEFYCKKCDSVQLLNFCDGFYSIYPMPNKNDSCDLIAQLVCGHSLIVDPYNSPVEVVSALSLLRTVIFEDEQPVS